MQDISSLVAAILGAAAAYDRREMSRACKELRRLLESASVPMDADAAVLIARTLQSARQFDLMRETLPVLIKIGIESSELRKRYAQCLIETQEYASAITALQEITAKEISGSKEWLEAYALLGRIHKQQYIGSSTDLQRSYAYYFQAFTHSKGDPYHAVNLLAIDRRAQADSVPLPIGEKGVDIANALLQRIAKDSSPSAWDLASLAEAYVYLNRSEDAFAAMQRYVDHKDVDAFAVAGTLRQMIEVWRLDSTVEVQRRILDVLRMRLLLLPGGEITGQFHELVRSDRPSLAQVEKVFGIDGAKTYDWLQKGLSNCRNVARLGRETSLGIGTGFLLPGNLLCESWGSDPVLLTNRHVLDPTGLDDAITPNECVVTFQARDEKQVYRVNDDLLWSSPVNELDVSVARLQEQVVVDHPYVLAPRMPIKSPRVRLYIIGHPSGGTLSFSLQDNELIDYDERLIHYRTPTEGGSSGSPVFNQQWELVGIHHAGSEQTKKLGKDGTYHANEGIRIDAIRAAIFRSTSSAL